MNQRLTGGRSFEAKAMEAAEHVSSDVVEP